MSILTNLMNRAAFALVLAGALFAYYWKSAPDWDPAPPIPSEWVATPEGKFAHSLVLPEPAKPAPYEFSRSLFRTPSKHATARYFEHLCETEAGQWIYKRPSNVVGLYFARPQGKPTPEQLADPYALEMPWIQRMFFLEADTPKDKGWMFVSPPFANFTYVEEPRRVAPWQEGFTAPFIRLYGYTLKPRLDHVGAPTKYFEDDKPMLVRQQAHFEARYGYTWRGIKRHLDREHAISGGEIIIYDTQTLEVIAVRRQFVRAPRSHSKALIWENAGFCRNFLPSSLYREFTNFAHEVLRSTERLPQGNIK